MERIVIHADLDAFFASCEERENPALKGKPVIIGADPKNGAGRGVVSTANYEARKFGIHSAMPISTAFRLCPEGVYLRPNFELYEKASSAVMGILRKRADRFEQTGIDEAFLDVSSAGSYENAVKIARELKTEVKNSERITISVGIAPNKTIAKIASDENKPDGLTVVEPEDVRNFIYPKSVRKIGGIGPKTDAILGELGIRTIKQLAEADPADMKKLLGFIGEYFVMLANGIDESPVEENYEIKSFNREHTFDVDTNDKQEIIGTIGALSKDLYNELKKSEAVFKTVTLKIRFSGFETHTRAESMKSHSDSEKTIKETAERLADEFLRAGRKIRLVGVRVSNLKFGEKQKTLADI